VERVLACECGFEARGANEDELVAAVRSHAGETHGMALSLEDARSLVSRAEPAEPLAPSSTASIDRKEER
jgi:predicted small metal-binding protein